jgi:hypothetical protein
MVFASPGRWAGINSSLIISLGGIAKTIFLPVPMVEQELSCYDKLVKILVDRQEFSCLDGVVKVSKSR